MSSIIKMTEIPYAAAIAYQKFLEGFPVWWPREYTWSKNKLKLIKPEFGLRKLRQ